MGRLVLLLALVAAATATLALTPGIREGATSIAPHRLDVPEWRIADGVPESALPRDPNETSTIRRTYAKGQRTVWVSAALFGRQHDPTRRASVNLIFPEANTSRIDRAVLRIAVDGRGDDRTEVPVLVGQKGGHRLAVAYWYQLGARPYGDNYRYRLALLRQTLVERRADAGLVRVASPLVAGEALEEFGAIVADLAPVLHGVLGQALDSAGFAATRLQP